MNIDDRVKVSYQEAANVAKDLAAYKYVRITAGGRVWHRVSDPERTFNLYTACGVAIYPPMEQPKFDYLLCAGCFSNQLKKGIGMKTNVWTGLPEGDLKVTETLSIEIRVDDLVNHFLDAQSAFKGYKVNKSNVKDGLVTVTAERKPVS